MDLNALRDAIAESPENIPLLLLHAKSCLEELSLEESRSGFEKVLRLQPDSAEAKLGIARILFLDGRTSEAVVRVQGILRESSGFAPAHLFLSRLYIGEEDLEGALFQYREAQALNKGMSDPALERALAALKQEREARQRGAVGDRVRLRAKSEADGHGGTGGDEEEEEEMPSFFEELEGYEESERPIVGFTADDFQKPAVSFAQVGGLEALREEMRMKIVYPLQHPELFRAYGKKAGGSLLLYGPPGCGKTLVCRALAGESSARFFEVGLHHVLEMYVGGGERNLHQIFNLARRHSPAVIFIDELESLAAGTGEGKSDAGRSLMHQLLEELDREDLSSSGVFVVAASSSPWNLDESLFRPGRFDRKILVPLPDSSARKAIFAILASDKPIVDLDLNYLASKTEGYSGAELKAIIDMATEEALALALKEDRIVPLTMAMFMQCVRRLRPSASRWQRKFIEAETERDRF